MPQTHTYVPRRHTRLPIYKQVQWDHRTAERLAGSLYDFSAGGAFLSPFGLVTHNIREGDVVWIDMNSDGDRAPLSGVVRWRGYSQRHSCTGFGLEFDELTQTQAVKLIDKLRSPSAK